MYTSDLNGVDIVDINSMYSNLRICVLCLCLFKYYWHIDQWDFDTVPTHSLTHYMETKQR